MRTLILALLIVVASGAHAQTDTSYRQPLFDFSYEKVPFKLNERQKQNKSKMLRFSILTGYREGVAPIAGLANFKVVPQNDLLADRVMMFNLSFQDMLTHGLMNFGRVILEVKDPAKYRYDTSYGDEKTWMRRNAHCFEMLVPHGQMNIDLIHQEMGRIFNVKFGSEKRMVDALVLVRTSNIDKIKSTGMNNGANGAHDGNGNFRVSLMQNVTDAIYLVGLPPAVDETGYTDAIDIDLNLTDWKDIPALRAALQRYDLDLKQEKRMMDMFVIRENDYKKP